MGCGISKMEVEEANQANFCMIDENVLDSPRKLSPDEGQCISSAASKRIEKGQCISSAASTRIEKGGEEENASKNIEEGEENEEEDSEIDASREDAICYVGSPTFRDYFLDNDHSTISESDNRSIGSEERSQLKVFYINCGKLFKVGKKAKEREDRQTQEYVRRSNSSGKL